MVSIVQQLQRRNPTQARSILLPRHRERETERMDLSGPRGDFPIPMHTAASPYGGIAAGGVAVADHVMDLHHDHANHNGQSQSQAQDMPSPPAAAVADDNSGKKRAAGIGAGGGPAVKYRECLKNHAAAIGGNATDGCGEFMPSGEEGSLEALKCSACGCHRNFHRKELDDFDGDSCASHGYGYGHHAVRRLLGPALSHHHKSSGGLLVTADHYGAYAAARALPPPPPPPPGHHHQIIMPLNMIQTSESDEMDCSGGIIGDGRGGLGSGGGGGGSSSSKKRFRTKFTVEQKARMLEFAEGVGWRLQKLDDAMVQHFCQEIGVKRRVLKVWMHNNKHNLARKPLPSSPPPQPQPQPIAVAMSVPMQMSMPPMQLPMAVAPSQPGPSSSCHRGPSSPRDLKLD